MKKYIWWALSILWMVVIYYMSSQNGEESTHTSSVVYNIIQFVLPNIEYNTSIIIIRKAAHVTEYLILMTFFYKSIQQINPTKAGFYALVGTVFYAMTDEFHQLYIIGRSGSVFDVMIDSLGALMFLALKNVISKI